MQYDDNSERAIPAIPAQRRPSDPIPHFPVPGPVKRLPHWLPEWFRVRFSRTK